MTDLDRWIDSDPVEVALKTGDRQLADRVDILRRAKYKLPSYYNARAVFSRIALEQSSSEAVAASRGYSGGELAVDLTCGLGVDSLYLSRCYRKVVSIEIDKARAADAASNFAHMGVSNIEVRNMSAEDFISSFDGLADVIFIDPARRDSAGRRIYDLACTSPDVISMLPYIRQHCRELFIKCSPMFDVRELRKIFSDSYSIETVSLDGECKETVVRYDGSAGCNMVTVLSSSGFVWRHRFGFGSPVKEGSPAWNYFVSFDVALVKAGVLPEMMDSFFPGVNFVTAGSYVIADGYVKMDGVLECRKITAVSAYQPAKLKRELGGRKFSILRKGFPISMELMKRQLGIGEGGKEMVAFVQVSGKRYMLSLEASQ